MIFFYKNNIGVGHTKFKHVEIDKKISEAIQRSNQRSMKHPFRVDVVHRIKNGKEVYSGISDYVPMKRENEYKD